MLNAACLCAQQQDSIVVTGTAQPIPLAEADRDVTSSKIPEQAARVSDLAGAKSLAERAEVLAKDLAARFR